MASHVVAATTTVARTATHRVAHHVATAVVESVVGHAAHTTGEVTHHGVGVALEWHLVEVVVATTVVVVVVVATVVVVVAASTTEVASVVVAEVGAALVATTSVGTSAHGRVLGQSLVRVHVGVGVNRGMLATRLASLLNGMLGSGSSLRGGELDVDLTVEQRMLV